MTTQQLLAFALIGGAIVAFASGRFRNDMVALVALVIGFGSGLVPAKQAFSGFTSDVVIIIAAALVISAAMGRSGFMSRCSGPCSAACRPPRRRSGFSPAPPPCRRFRPRTL